MFSTKIYERIFIYLFLSLLATILSAYMSLDSKAYLDIFSNYSISGWGELLKEIKSYELFFLISAKVFNGFSSLYWLFLISLFSVGLKVYLISIGSRNFYISMLFYFSYFFVLLDGTQIRVSLAIAISFFGAYLFSKNKLIFSLIFLAVSFLFFHYSLVFFVVVYFFLNRKTTPILIFLWPLLAVFWLLGFDVLSISKMVFSYADNNWIGFNQLDSYLNEFDIRSAPYSFQFILLFFSTILVYLRYRDELTSFELICFNCVFMSFVILGVFVGASALQNRVSEIFRFGLVFIFPFYYRYCLEFIDKKWLANTFFGIALVSYFYYYVLLAGLIRWPQEWGVFHG